MTIHGFMICNKNLFPLSFWHNPMNGPRYYRDHLEQHEPLLRKVEEGFMCQAGQWDLEGLRQVQHVCDWGGSGANHNLDSYLSTLGIFIEFSGYFRYV